MSTFKRVGTMRQKHLNYNEITFHTAGHEYTFILTNDVFDKVQELYTHKPGEAFNVAKKHNSVRITREISADSE